MRLCLGGIFDIGGEIIHAGVYHRDNSLKIITLGKKIKTKGWLKTQNMNAYRQINRFVPS